MRPPPSVSRDAGTRARPSLGARARRRARLVAAVLLLCGAAFACSREIGDECSLSIDCAPDGTRQCDFTQPGGYCTVEGCDVGTCPEEAVCVRFFPLRYLSRACDPQREDRDADVCPPEDICLAEGLCAPRTTERRFCVVSCESDGDCREGYHCRYTNTGGAELIPQAGKALGVARFCAPLGT